MTSKTRPVGLIVKRGRGRQPMFPARHCARDVTDDNGDDGGGDHGRNNSVDCL